MTLFTTSQLSVTIAICSVLLCHGVSGFLPLASDGVLARCKTSCSLVEYPVDEAPGCRCESCEPVIAYCKTNSDDFCQERFAKHGFCIAKHQTTPATNPDTTSTLSSVRPVEFTEVAAVASSSGNLAGISPVYKGLFIGVALTALFLTALAILLGKGRSYVAKFTGRIRRYFCQPESRNTDAAATAAASSNAAHVASPAEVGSAASPTMVVEQQEVDSTISQPSFRRHVTVVSHSDNASLPLLERPEHDETHEAGGPPGIPEIVTVPSVVVVPCKRADYLAEV